MVDAWRGSGQSQLVFARRYGFDAQRLGYWARRLRRETAGAESPMQFHPVRLVNRVGATVATGERPPIEIVFDDGRSVRVSRGVDPGELRLVLEVLSEGRC